MLIICVSSYADELLPCLTIVGRLTSFLRSRSRSNNLQKILILQTGISLHSVSRATGNPMTKSQYGRIQKV